MKVIYVIGGICNGKSILGKSFAQKGAVYFDLDKISQFVLEKPEVIEQVKMLSDDVVVENGIIDKEAHQDYLFSNKLVTHAFDRAIFPHIKEELDRQLSDLDDDSIVVVEYSGYFGDSRDEDIFLKDADAVVWVESRLKDKIERGKKRGIENFELTWRMRVQPYDEEYEAVADYVIHNNSTIEALDERIDEIWASCCK